MNDFEKIGFGGGCHWCTEAVFQSLKGVIKVKQGYIASTGDAIAMNEAVIVYFNPKEIEIKNLIEVHLHTHSSTVLHSFRKKYRSAIYFFTEVQKKDCIYWLEFFQKDFSDKIITQILPFSEFKSSRESIQDYFRKNPEAPFCKTYILPKLEKINNLPSQFKNG